MINQGLSKKGKTNDQRRRAYSLIIVGMIICAVFPLTSSKSHNQDLIYTNGKEHDLSKEEAINLTFQFSPPKLEKVGGYERIKMQGLQNHGSPGEPVLPFKTIKILLPPFSKIENIDVLGIVENRLNVKYEIEPGQRCIPLSLNRRATVAEEPFTPLNKDIYNSLNPYPGRLYSEFSIQQFRGYRILILNLYPIQYVPQSGTITYFEEMDVRITIAPENINISDAKMFRHSPIDEARVKEMVENLWVINSYEITTPTKGISEQELTSIVDPTDTFEYVIVTNEALKSSSGEYTFQDLVDSKISKGLNATIVTVEAISTEPAYWDSNPLFNDTQAQIRNFIRDAYINWETEYILLGGDGDLVEGGENIIPIRGFYAYCQGEALNNGEFLEDESIPSDLYYGCLDGNFNNDEDIFWAEPTDGIAGGEVDLVAEVYIGRAPVDNETELSNFVMKTLTYENSVDSYLGDVWMAGEWLGFGGESEYAGNSLDEIKDGSDAHGYTTAGIPDEYYVSTLYDRDETWPVSDIIKVINNGTHIINHLGHAWIGYVMKMDVENVDGLTNQKFFFGYSQGCYPGAFDDNDCIIEHFVCNPTGAFAFVANTRYGIGKYDSTDGPGERFNRQFFDAVFGENIRNLGRANQDSKEDNIGYLHNGEKDSCDMRWCYYEITLFGDPEVSIKNRPPQVHDLIVTEVKAPTHTWPNTTILINATIKNGGLNDDSNINVNFTVNGAVENSTTISLLEHGAYSQVFFEWEAPDVGEYVVEVEATPVQGENITKNNRRIRNIIAALYPSIRVSPEALNLTRAQGNVFVEVINETVYGPSIGGEIGPFFLDHGYIINCSLYLDIAGEEWMKLSEGGDYLLNYATGEIDTSPIEPYEAGWTFYAYYNHSKYPFNELLVIRNNGTATLDITITEDESWLSAFPIFSSVAVDNQTNISIELDTTELEAGKYYGEISIGSNDLDRETVVVPVELKVLLPDHDISLKNLIAPTQTEVSKQTYANVTVDNKGRTNETDISIYFKINGTIVNTTIIPLLDSETSTYLNFSWTPSSVGVHVIEILATPIPGENLTTNNHVEKNVTAAFYKVRNLDKDSHHPTIQSGIDKADEGDSIFVEAGIYLEQVIINKSVKLIGENKDNTTIDGGGENAVYLKNVRWGNITGFTVRNAGSGNSGIHVYASAVNITDCSITGNDFGIKCEYPYSYFSSNVQVSNCTIENNDVGIQIKYSDGNTIKDTTIQNNNDAGIRLFTSNGNLIKTCTIVNGKFGIFLLENSHNNIIDNNIVSSNDWYGILFESSAEHNIIANNIIDSNGYGINLFKSDSNTLFNNTVEGSDWDGIYLDTSNSNTIYHNNIINNTIQAYDNGLNIWDNGYPSGGNYWSDYNGTDIYSGPNQDISGSDGIGDINYTISGGSKVDNYPLMMPFEHEYINFTFVLSEGWNLISIPLIQTDESLDKVLKSIEGKWDYIMTYDASDSDHWKTNSTHKPVQLNDLHLLNNQIGFWINITEPGVNLTIGGYEPTSTTITLYAGWNLVGYPTLNCSMTVANALWGTGADKVEVFDQLAPYQISEAGSTYVMKPGEGYWIHVPADTTWVIEW